MVLRVAVYATPRPGTAWHRLAAAWMGYDPVAGIDVRRTDVPPADECSPRSNGRACSSSTPWSARSTTVSPCAVGPTSAFPLDDLVVLTQRGGAPFVELTRVPLGGHSGAVESEVSP